MEHMEVQRNKGPRASVPQFGGWDQKKKGASEADLGYTVVFTKARADRQHQKNDLTDVKRQSHQQLKEHLLHHQDNLPSNNNKPKAHHKSPHHHKKHDRRHGKPEEEDAFDSGSATSNPMRKKRNMIMSWFFGCYWP
ncbi:hypothetical protein K1719_014894 [Acacia pycnantha]|nr:hypothetical protein K1719_014894 [Acacia pycnantha]